MTLQTTIATFCIGFICGFCFCLYAIIKLNWDLRKIKEVWE